MMRYGKRCCTLSVVLALVLLGLAVPSMAATVVVSDHDAATLRDAIENAMAGDLIVLAKGGTYVLFRRDPYHHQHDPHHSGAQGHD
jgi:hypothetical protein